MTAHGFTRRDFIKSLGIGTAALVLSRGSSGKTPPKKPNILFFFTDDQRFDTIHALGNDHVITPTMDSLVERGTTFTNAYIMGGQSAAVCMPSRAMLMTGRHLFHIRDNGSIIPTEHVMLPELLRKHGYATFETGKWHNGPPSLARSFTDGGKIFFGGMSDHYRVPVRDFDPEGKYPKDLTYHDEGTHSSELFSDAAIRFLRTHREDRPFFLYIAYTAPHDPREMPEEYLNLYDPDRIPLPENFLPEHPFDNGELEVRDEQLAQWPRTPREIRGHIAAYYAMITHVDAQIGRVINALRETGRADNTIIVFAGDNGLAVGQHGLMGKQNVYEHSVHVPLIMSGPGIPAGERRDAFCYLYDIFPTLCDLTGIEVPVTVDGISLVPSVRNGSLKARDSLFFAYKNYQRAVRTERWKLILYNVNGKKTTQLFDLARDPRETTNLAAASSYAGRISELTSVMNKWLEKTGDKVDLDKPDWGVPVIPGWRQE